MEERAGPRGNGQTAELARIETAYRERDASDAASPYAFVRPGYALYMQLLEWSLLDALRRSPVQLQGARVLDVGCGTGYMLNRLLEFGAGAVTGVDLMPGRIESARLRYPGLRFERANAAELPFGDAEFDIVTQFTCLSSVLDAGLRTAIAAEMWRVVRPGGIVVSYDIRPPTLAIRSMRWWGGWRRRRLGHDAADVVTPVVEISRGELRRLFPSASVRYASTGLAFGLCGIAGRSDLGARLLARVPVLREHGIAVLVRANRD